MTTTIQSPIPFGLSELRELILPNIPRLYSLNTNPNYDMDAVAFLVDANRKITVCMLTEDHPAVLLPRLIQEHQAVAYGLACATWLRDPETNERCGEGILASFETLTDSEVWSAKVTRNPLPVPGEFIKGDSASGRLTHLLHHPDTTTH